MTAEPPDTTAGTTAETTTAGSTAGSTAGTTDDRSRGPLGRLGADWAAVIVAAVLVLLAGLGLLPSIPFLIT